LALVACRSSSGFEPGPETGYGRSTGSASLVIVGPSVIRTKGLYTWDAQVSGVSLTSCELYWSVSYPPSTVPTDLGAGVEQKLLLRAGDADFLLKVGASCLYQTATLRVLNRIGVEPS